MTQFAEKIYATEKIYMPIAPADFEGSPPQTVRAVVRDLVEVRDERALDRQRPHTL
jgi:hypothetical protein